MIKNVLPRFYESQCIVW